MGKVACFRPHSSVDPGWRKAGVRCLLRAGLSLQPRFIPCGPRRPTLVFFLPLADTDVFYPCLDADIYFIKRKCTFNIYLRCSVRLLKLFCMLPCYSNKSFYVIFKTVVISCRCEEWNLHIIKEYRIKRQEG